MRRGTRTCLADRLDSRHGSEEHTPQMERYLPWLLRGHDAHGFDCMSGRSIRWQPLIGVTLGVALIAVLDKVTPHLHHIAGLDEKEESHSNANKSINRVLLFVMAIAIHKFPEGLAAGVVFDGGDMTNAYTVAITIAIQNIPEGMVVVTPLIMIGVNYWRVTAVSLAVALLEIAGVIAGYFLGDISSSHSPPLPAARCSM